MKFLLNTAPFSAFVTYSVESIAAYIVATSS